eukprot:1160463-Pelagomonas_calceolata.AAC.4
MSCAQQRNQDQIPESPKLLINATNLVHQGNINTFIKSFRYQNACQNEPRTWSMPQRWMVSACAWRDAWTSGEMRGESKQQFSGGARLQFPFIHESAIDTKFPKF